MGGDTGRGATGVGFGAGAAASSLLAVVRCWPRPDSGKERKQLVVQTTRTRRTFFTQAEAKNNSRRTEARSLTALGHGETWVRRGWMLVECPVLASTCTYGLLITFLQPSYMLALHKYGLPLVVVPRVGMHDSAEYIPWIAAGWSHSSPRRREEAWTVPRLAG